MNFKGLPPCPSSAAWSLVAASPAAPLVSGKEQCALSTAKRAEPGTQKHYEWSGENGYKERCAFGHKLTYLLQFLSTIKWSAFLSHVFNFQIERKWQPLKENNEHSVRYCISKVRANSLVSLDPRLKTWVGVGN